MIFMFPSSPLSSNLLADFDLDDELCKVYPARDWF